MKTPLNTVFSSRTSRLAATFLSLLALPLCAQDISGIISGTIVDPSDAAVPSASITLTQTATGVKKSLTTDESGSFAFLSVLPGQYSLSVAAQGFKGFERQNINLTSSERLALGRIQMQVGASTESITVVSQGAVVQTESSERSAVITSAQIENLSSLSRSWTTYMLTTPSVYNDPGEGGSPSIAGQPQSSNSVNLDGIGGDAENGGPRFRVNLDQIAELKVIQTNPPAEYGFHPGAVIDIVTKSGTRDFHGSGAYYKRHEQFNANSFFNNRLGQGKARYRFNNYVASIGGPVYIPGKFNVNRDKLFFFFTDENQRTVNPTAIRTVTVPTALERQGDFSQSVNPNGSAITIIDPNTKAAFPGNVIPSSRIDPNTQKLLSLFPLPNFTNRAISQGNYNYTFQEVQPQPYDKYFMKGDWIINDKLHFTFSNSIWSQKTGGYAVGAGFANWGQIAAGYKTGALSDPTGRLTYTITPTAVNELLFGGHYFYEDVWNPNQTELDKYNRVKAGINIPYLYPQNANQNNYHLIPTTSFGGVTNAANFSADTRFPIHTINRRYAIADNFTKTIGSHTLKAGFFWQNTTRDYGSRGNYYGSLNFDNNANNPLNTGYAYSNAILGIFNQYSEASSYFVWKTAGAGIEWYAQDTWKVNRKLTLNYGLRLSYIIPRTNNTTGVGAAFNPGFYDPSKRVTLYQPGLSGTTRVAVNPLTGQTANAVLINAIVPGSGDPANGMVQDSDPRAPRGLIYNPGVLPSPRFGFAYDPMGDGKTSIRGGFAIMYETEKTNGDLQPYNPPVQFNPIIYFSTVSQIPSSAGALQPSNVTGKDFTGNLPTTYSYSLGVQRDLGWGTVVDVAYVAVLGRHILANQPLNNIPYGARFLASNLDPTTGRALPDPFLRPIPGYGTVNMVEYTGSSNYHSMQTQINRRFARGVQFGGAWTWSKAMDYGGEYGAYPQYASRRVLSYGKAGTDRTHILNINWLWELPKASKLNNNFLVKALFDNWRYSGIASFITGAPQGIGLSASDGTDFSGGGDGQRVNLTCDPVLPKSDRTFDRVFNTSCISLPGLGSVGTASRNVFRGPGTNNWNMSLFRTFPIKERFLFELRAETYNTFNHTQFNAVNTNAQFNRSGVITNTAFGQYSGAANPRFMQLSGRVTF